MATTEYAMTATVVEVDSPPYLYIDITTPPLSPSPDPMQPPVVSNTVAPACRDSSSLRAEFLTPPHRILGPSVYPFKIGTLQRWPEDDESNSEEDEFSSEDDEPSSEDKASSHAEEELQMLATSFRSKKPKAHSKCLDTYWVIMQDKIMGIYDDKDEMQDTNVGFHTVQMCGFTTLNAAQGAWDHAWRNEKIAYHASGLSSTNEPDVNNNIELFWVILKGITPGIHWNHADTMAAVREYNLYLLRIAWNMADAYEIQNWDISHGLIKYHQ
ncbi:hypothetical protein EV421DRAFT_1907215 [Armillaria borealis]|uniref:Uncharacterized protein n=1 Tax=Armillaria borealis TaxID=47425 RepID=A0AA39J8M3_9AGAR|nr:hypothetical protein EV421DRAFT_1907215 [Armillaria borealis]